MSNQRSRMNRLLLAIGCLLIFKSRMPQETLAFQLDAQTPVRTLSQGSSRHSVSATESHVEQERPTSFLTESFTFSECDNSNTPPSLAVILRSLKYLFQKNKSDLRGRYVSHATHGSLLGVAHALKQASVVDDQPLLSPFLAYCIGYAIGKKNPASLAIGRDPRMHGTALADALARGAIAAGITHVIDLGVATTPACAAYTKVNDSAVAVVGCDAYIGSLPHPFAPSKHV